MRRKIRHFSGIIDVRPLNEREKILNTRKGMLKAEIETSPIRGTMELPLFGNPYQEMTEQTKQVIEQNNDFVPDSMVPD
jgi:hypothetical protein